MKKLISVLLVTMMVLGSVFALAEDWTCPSCSTTVSGNFCNNCGTAKPSTDWVCPNCNITVSGNFCSNCGTAKPTDNVEQPVIPTAEPAAPSAEPSETPAATEDGYSVTKKYTWSTMWGNYYAMSIKNTSGTKCGFEVRVVFQDKNNGIVGVSNPSVTVCDDGYEVLVTASCDTAFDHVEYTITPTQSNWYNDIHSYVSVTAQKVGNKAIITAANSGTVDADFVEYHCLFLDKKGNVVGTGWGYLVDNSSQLKSGKTELREETCYEDFDTVEVWFEGRTDKSTVNTGTVEVVNATTEAEGYEISKEYAWSTMWSNSYALVVKNTSGSTCGFDAQVVFYDKNDCIVGVSNPSATVCGDGYEVILIASQDSAYDHVSYTITPVKTSWYEDVHSFVEVTASKTGKKAILSAKNNGTKNAEFVEYHCLFLDKKGNVVATDWGYLVDNDSVIKPGKTEMREASAYVDFNSVEVYFEGRCSK